MEPGGRPRGCHLVSNYVRAQADHDGRSVRAVACNAAMGRLLSSVHPPRCAPPPSMPREQLRVTRRRRAFRQLRLEACAVGGDGSSAAEAEAEAAQQQQLFVQLHREAGSKLPQPAGSAPFADDPLRQRGVERVVVGNLLDAMASPPRGKAGGGDGRHAPVRRGPSQPAGGAPRKTKAGREARREHELVAAMARQLRECIAARRHLYGHTLRDTRELLESADRDSKGE